jgi:hypothetical protein
LAIAQGVQAALLNLVDKATKATRRTALPSRRACGSLRPEPTRWTKFLKEDGPEGRLGTVASLLDGNMAKGDTKAAAARLAGTLGLSDLQKQRRRRQRVSVALKSSPRSWPERIWATITSFRLAQFAQLRSL